MRLDQRFMFKTLWSLDKVLSSLLRTEYMWQKIKESYNKKCYYEVYDHTSGINPISVQYVDPENIKYITGREHKPWSNKSGMIGSVQDGDWDQRSMKNTSRYPRQFDEWGLARSFNQHFKKGIPWEETRIYSEYRDAGRSHKYTIHTLAYYDKVVDLIKNEGYRTQKDLYLNSGKKDSVWSAILDEVAVDIGRNGELLFVDGRHRLLAAKLLNLNSIPVIVLVRHQQWIDKYVHNSDTQSQDAF